MSQTAISSTSKRTKRSIGDTNTGIQKSLVLNFSFDAKRPPHSQDL